MSLILEYILQKKKSCLRPTILRVDTRVCQNRVKTLGKMWFRYGRVISDFLKLAQILMWSIHKEKVACIIPVENFQHFIHGPKIIFSFCLQVSHLRWTTNINLVVRWGGIWSSSAFKRSSRALIERYTFLEAACPFDRVPMSWGYGFLTLAANVDYG